MEAREVFFLCSDGEKPKLGLCSFQLSSHFIFWSMKFFDSSYGYCEEPKLLVVSVIVFMGTKNSKECFIDLKKNYVP